MLIYILKFSACLAALLIFYKLFLERESVHFFKRFYLLAALVFSFVVPALVFTDYVSVEPIVEPIIQPTSFKEEVINVSPALEKDILDIAPLLWGLYFIGVIFFSIQFIKNLIQVLRRIKNNPKEHKESFVRVLLQENFHPHTFFKYIFLNKLKLHANEIPKEVLLHEETHAKQKHSIDVLFIEIMLIILWFNPLIYFMRKSIKLNHEFLADKAVLNKGVASSTYQNTLLSFMTPANQQSLANAINYSSIKKRFTVMKTQTSKKSVFFRSLMLLPLLGILLISFSQKKYLEIYPEVPQKIEGNWLEKNTENYVFSISSQNEVLTLYWRETFHPIKLIDNKYFVEVNGTEYPIVLDKENRVLTLWRQDFVSEANSFRKKFEGEWESEKGDVKMSIINYTDEFIWTITQDGRSNQYYPKKTDDGFHFTYGKKLRSFKKENDKIYDSNGLSYYRVLKKPSDLLSSNSTEETLGTGEIIPEFTSETDGMDASSAEIEEYNMLVNKYVDSQSGKTRMLMGEVNRLQHLHQIMPPEHKTWFVTMKKFTNSYDAYKENGATQKQFEQYNSLALKYNKQPIEVRRIPLKDLKILETIYKEMSSEQKERAAAFPECLPQKSKAQEGASKKQIAEYNGLAQKYNAMSSSNYRILKSDIERMEYLYDLMTAQQKREAEPFPHIPTPPPPPPAPEATIAPEIQAISVVAPTPPRVEQHIKSNVSVAPSLAPAAVAPVIAVSPNVAPVPPLPPPPKSPIEFVEEMAKKNAEFYYNGKKITAAKAIELLEESTHLSLRAKHTNLKRPKVELSDEPLEIKED